MLNLPIAMLKAILVLTILFQELTPAITFPLAGEPLRGQVEIQGATDIADFASAELAFTFDETASDPGAAWFPIQTFSQPQPGPLLAVWDTTTLTDDDYTLRLRVFLLDGSFQDVLVPNLKIRNYTPDPTATPTLPPTEPPTQTPPPFFSLGTAPPPASGETPTPASAFPTPTPLPINPASISTSDILTIFGKSALVIIGLFFFISLILRLRKNT
jgi:hypothetical protein